MKWQREAEYLKLTWECQRQNWSQRRNISPSFSFFFFGDLVVGPVVVETQEKLTVERRKVSENHAVPIQKKDLTESPFDYAQQSSSSQKRAIAMTSKTLPQLSWSSTQKKLKDIFKMHETEKVANPSHNWVGHQHKKNSKTSLKCMKLRRLHNRWARGACDHIDQLGGPG